MVLDIAPDDFRCCFVSHGSGEVAVLPKLSAPHLALHARELLEDDLCADRFELPDDFLWPRSLGGKLTNRCT
jgi:hypothetical protein